LNEIRIGDCLTIMKLLVLGGIKVQTCVTSPPYFRLRDYGMEGQLGLEETPEAYVGRLVEVFRLVRELLADDGTLWLNLGDSYNAAGRIGHGNLSEKYKQSTNRASANGVNVGRPNAAELKEKDLIGIPWRAAFALQADGWYLRSDIIWAKPNPMPESVTDRPTKSHEYIFLLSKSADYFYDAEAIAEPATHAGKIATLGEKSLSRGQANGAGIAASGNGTKDSVTVADVRNRRSVWTVSTQPYAGAHFATFPPDLILPCVLAGSRPGDVVFDPFMGSGTTALVAKENGRRYLGCELNPAYKKLQEERLQQEVLFGPEVPA
jgi:DNA modification methylase